MSDENADMASCNKQLGFQQIAHWRSFWSSDEHLFFLMPSEFAFSVASGKVYAFVTPNFLWKPTSVSAHTELKMGSNWVPHRSLRWADESCGRKVCAAKQRFSSSFRVLKSCVCVCVWAHVCKWLYILPPPLSRISPELPSLCFGTRSHLLWCSAGRYTTGAALSLSCWTFREGKKGKGKIKNSPVMWSAEPPPENSWHNNLNDQMIQRRLVSWETAS